MMKINLTNWKSFRLGDYFNVESPIVSAKLDLEEYGFGVYPFITGQSTNNGADGCYNFFTENGNVITIDRIMYSFVGYQELPFSANDNVKVLKPKFNLTRNIGLFLTSVLKKEKYRYCYGRITSKKRLEDTILRLPESNGQPDWNFMENYVGILYTKTNTIKKEPLNEEKIDLGNKNWDFFNLVDLFEIKGSKTTSLLDLAEYGSGRHPFVTTQATNNGIEGFYDYFTEKGLILTIDSAVLGYCSYQPYNFSASDHVEKLIPKFSMSKYVAMFLVTILNKEQYRYNYGRKCSQDRMKKRTIKLPAKDKKPDFVFMENYIKSLEYSANI